MASFLSYEGSGESERCHQGGEHPRVTETHVATTEHGPQQTDRTGCEKTGSSQVESVGFPFNLFIEAEQEQTSGHHTDRQVDQEDPLPRPLADDQSAKSRSGDARDRPHRRENALDTGAFLRRVQVTDDGEGYRGDTGTQTLQPAPQNQLLHRGSSSAQHRTEHEQARANEVGRFPTEQIGRLPVQRHRDRRGQKVDRKHPWVESEAAELSDDGRHRRADDRDVD